MATLEGITLFIFGICIGSFLNVLADRLSNEETILGRSHYDSCKKQLSWYELIPLVSYFAQTAKCRSCRAPLSFFYPLVELVTGITFVLVWFYFPVDFITAAYPNLETVFQTQNFIPLMVIKLTFLAIMCCIIVMFFADLKYFIIPDWIQLALAYLALLLFFIGSVDLHNLVYRLGSAIIVMLPMLGIFMFTKGRGLGFGDVKLAANLGLFMGIQYAFSALYLSFIIGALTSCIVLVLRKGNMKTKIPFGPFILIGVCIVMFAFPLIQHYLYYYYGF
jgi:prepilin signal peptidase PulO-like enzyme (type II secretory pathway)